MTISADDGSDEEIMEYISSPGIYYVAVSAWEGAGSYSLTVLSPLMLLYRNYNPFWKLDLIE